MEHELIEKLTNIGLTEGEAKTYIALLSIGTTTVGPIIEKSGVSASKVYQILERLMQKGLATMVVEHKNKIFTATTPTSIIEYLNNEQKKIEENKKKINEIMPILKLKKDSATTQPIAEIGKAKRGVEALYRELIETARLHSNCYTLAGLRISTKLQTLWFPQSQRMSEKGIIQKMIYEYDVWYKKDPKIHRRKERKNYYPKVLDQKYKDLPNIQVIDKKTLIIDIDENDEVFALIIRNENLTNTFKKLIQLISDMGKIPEGYKEQIETKKHQ